MCKRNVLAAAVLFFLFTSSAFSQYVYSRIIDPDRPWYYYSVNVEEAVLSVKPKGIYMEMGLYITLSGRSANLNAQTQYEIFSFFDLPEEAIIHDLWLWVGEDIMRATILDKWTASAIYEDIVDRRRDPAILFKRSSTRYELRIYPMLGDQSRKIKLTYLVPVSWYNERVSASLPIHLVRDSGYHPETFHVLFWGGEQWENPKIDELPDVQFEKLTDPEFGLYQRCDLMDEGIETAANISATSPMQDGVFLSRFSSGEDDYYQMALLPSELLDININKKVAFLFDYDPNKTTYNKSTVLNTVKNNLLNNFSAKDSFNLIFSGISNRLISSAWIPADSASVEQAFATAGSDPISDYSNLPSLLASGIEFVKNNGDKGVLFTMSATDQQGWYSTANPIIDDLLETMDNTLPVYILDYCNKNREYYYFNGRYHYGNEYFYSNLSRRTYGDWLRVDNSGYAEAYHNLYKRVSGFVTSFDLYTTLSDGFCFGRQTLSGSSETVYLDSPIMQVGKFFGSFPFELQINGIFDGQPFSQKITKDEQHISQSDSLVEEMWAGNYISALERSEQTSDIISEILDVSISERVLSQYTAFLALEPSDTVQPCLDCRDESGLTALTDVQAKNFADSLIQVSPNPFNNQTTILLTLSEKTNPNDVSASIYNILGQAIYKFNLSSENGNEIRLVWDGKNQAGNNLSSGTYFLIVKVKDKVFKKKLLLLK